MDVEQRGRLEDILAAGRLIATYVGGISEKRFVADTEKQDAVIRRLEIIGEATRHLSDETRGAVVRILESFFDR